MSDESDPREPLGRIVHETRLAFNAKLDKPFGLQPWEQRSPLQRELDVEMGHAVANYALTENAATYDLACPRCAGFLDRAYEDHERAERANARLAEIREVIDGFFAYYGNTSMPFLEKARDLAEGIRQVLDRDKISDEGETQ